MEKNRLGMAIFLGSEAVFFILLILGYLNFRSASNPVAAQHLEPAVTAIFTASLLASSLTLWQAERSFRNQKASAPAWLLITLALGAIFLIGQGMEYMKLFQENITPARGLFGTTFFTLTGLHGLHVFSGLLILAILSWLAFKGFFRSRQPTALETFALYWHFVDGVWIVIFTVVYLGTLI
jgi:heme/copper-type cytochrome/quinol oxidase subunit 3